MSISPPPAVPVLPEKKKSRGRLLVLLLIGAVLITTCVWYSRAAGRSAAKAATAPARWPVQEVAGMRLAMPEVPVMGRQDAPEEVRDVVEGGTFDVGTLKTPDFQIGLVHVIYTGGDVSLEGMRDGAMAGLEALPEVSRMVKRPRKRTISGKPALTMEASYYVGWHKMFHGAIFVMDGREAWQASVIGRPAEGAAAWDRVLETFAIPKLEAAE